MGIEGTPKSKPRQRSLRRRKLPGKSCSTCSYSSKNITRVDDLLPTLPKHKISEGSTRLGIADLLKLQIGGPIGPLDQ